MAPSSARTCSPSVNAPGADLCAASRSGSALSPTYFAPRFDCASLAATASKATDDIVAPRVRRIRVAMEVPLEPPSSAPFSPIGVIDYGPCQTCGRPVGTNPYNPSRLVASVSAASRAFGMGLIQHFEHQSVVQCIDEITDPLADVSYFVNVPPRQPANSECSESCSMNLKPSGFSRL